MLRIVARRQPVRVFLPGHVRVRAADQLPDQDVLGVVGVLVFVHEHVPEPAPVLLGDLGEDLQQADRRHDQVIEVHRPGRGQPALVLRVRLGQRLAPVAVRGGREALVVDELVLEPGHLGQQRLGRVILGVKIQLAADQRHQPLRVGLVVDGERGREAEPLRLPAQDPHAGRVERHHPHGPRPGSGQRGHPGRHLARRLVRERDRDDLRRRDVPLGEQVGDPVREHACLARARARHDQQRAALVHHRRALLRVQSFE
jgi:hypothetical protein